MLRLALAPAVIGCALGAGPRVSQAHQVEATVQPVPSPDGPAPGELAAASGGGTVYTPTIPVIAPEPRVPYPNHRAEQQWFYGQRAQPRKTTPAGAAVRALQQAASIPEYTPSGTGPHTAALTPWTSVGPAPTNPNNGWGSTSGRVTALAYDGANHILYAGGAAGGVWKSANNGATWTPLTDTQPSLAIGALAIDPSNPQIIYAGTGEANYNIDGYYADGILKSTDGGATWTVLAQETFGQYSHISTIVVDPRNTQHVLVAGDMGVWLSTDGGASWQVAMNCMNVGGNCITPDVTDLVVDSATNPSTVYAAVGYPFGGSGGFAGTLGALNGIYKSTDGGAFFSSVPVGTGYPTGDSIGRIALARGNANHRLLYMTASDPATTASLGVWSSTNAGATWTQVAKAQSAGGPDLFGNDTNHAEQQGWYDMFLAVDPANDASLYVGGINIFHSADGGHTWADLTHVYNALGPTVHPDQHTIAFSGAGAPSPFFVGNDGGVYGSTTGGSSWNDNNGNLAITEFYGGSTTAALGANTVIWGGSQDNGTQKYTGNPVWTQEIGGDGTLTANDPSNPNIAYQEYPGLGVNKTTDGGATWFPATTGINPNHTDFAEWVAPMVMDPTNPNRLLAGTNYLYETTNGAASWTRISSTSLSPFAAISAIAIARSAPRTIYVGTGDGKLWVTTNDGGTWTDRTAGTVGALGYFVTALAVSPTNPLDVVVTFSGFDGAGNGGHVYRSANGGATWQDVSTSLPDTPVSSVLRNPTNPGIFYLGTDSGFFFTTNGGAGWKRYQLGLPTAPIDQLFADGSFSTFVLATHGRGMFTLPTSALGGQGTTYYVAPTGNDGNACLAATSPCATIGAALGKANSGDTISIAAGTYAENLTISKDITLLGAGPTQTIIDANYTGTAVTIPGGVVAISGVAIRNGNGATHCPDVTCGGGIYNAGTLTLSNSALSNNSADYGGAIFNQGLLRASTVTFSGNNATFGGGAIDNGYNGGITMTGSTLSGNSAGFGGAMLEYGALTLSGSRVTGNTATSGNGGGIYLDPAYITTIKLISDVISNNTAQGTSGGGIYAIGGTLNVVATTFAGDRASEGGGIFLDSYISQSFSLLTVATIANSIISGNTAFRGGGIETVDGNTVSIAGSRIIGNAASYAGGGIRSTSQLTITGSTLSNNIAANAGGGVFNDGYQGSLTLTTSTVSGNRAPQGGGVFNNTVSLTVIASTISANAATNGPGGGIYNNSGALRVTNSTLSGNSTTASGGGIYNQVSATHGGVVLASSTISANRAAAGGGVAMGPSAATPQTKNTIIAANTATGTAPDCNGALASTGYNLLGSSAGCSGLTNGVNGDQVGSAATPLSPGLGPLQSNGGPTTTMALQSTSPAVNGGNPTGCTDPQGAPLTTDQRGQPRPDPVDHRCDAGAYELQNP